MEGSDGTLSGRWSLVSGCQAATQFALLADIVEDGKVRELAAGIPDRRFAFVPASAVTIIDTWDASGLRATGSHDVAVEKVHVPMLHTCPLIGPANPDDEGLDRFPLTAIMGAGAATMLVTLAQVARDALVAIAADAQPTDSRQAMTLRPAVSLGIARATANIRAARHAIRHALAGVVDAVQACQAVPPATAVELSEAIDLAKRLSMEAIRSLYDLAGTAAVYTDSPLGRSHGDALVMVQHITFDPMWLEQAGRYHLGQRPGRLI